MHSRSPKRNTIMVNGRLYEKIADVKAFYLPNRNDILEDLEEITDDLKEIFSKDIPKNVKNRELNKKFSDAFIAVDSLREYIQKNYDRTERM